jgi:hypothetical protein
VTQAIYLQKSIQTYGLSSSPTHTIFETSFVRSTPNRMLLGHCQHQLYLQPKHQQLHNRGDSHIRIGESMSLPIHIMYHIYF